MKAILIRRVTIADPESDLNGKTADVFIRDGVLTMETPANAPCDVEIDGTGLFLSPGWIDSLAFCGEPGEEWKEDLASLAAAAASGGFTKVAAFCGYLPFPDKATAIAAIVGKSAGLPVKILPLGTATKGREGKQMSEIYDMKSAGAVAFTDGEIPVSHSGLKARIMEYAANCNAPFLDFTFDPDLASSGLVHDGPVGNSLGLKGIPAIAEINALSEAIRLAKWLKTPLRVVGISTAESVQLIREARNHGLEIYASVPVMNLLHTDSDLSGFDENFKVLPPLRSETDRQALIEGLADGTLDAVYSNHQPQDTESKDVEFEYAAYGAIGIQTVLGMILRAAGEKLNNDVLVRALYYGPAALLGIPAPSAGSEKPMDYTLFSRNGEWNWNRSNNLSKSRNSALLNNLLPGYVAGVIVNGNWIPQLNSTAQK